MGSNRHQVKGDDSLNRSIYFLATSNKVILHNMASFQRQIDNYA